MEEEPRLHVQLAVGTWAMFSRARDFQHRLMNAIVSTVFRSNLCLRNPHETQRAGYAWILVNNGRQKWDFLQVMNGHYGFALNVFSVMRAR